MKQKRPTRAKDWEITLADIAFGDYYPQLQFDDIDENWNPIPKKKVEKGRFSSGSKYIYKRNSNMKLKEKKDDSTRNEQD